MIAKVEHEEKFLQFAIVQYTVNMSSDEAKMLFATPANSRKRSRPSVPQVRTKPSVLERMREMGSKSSAKQIINNIQNELGGAVSISSPSDIPETGNKFTTSFEKLKEGKKPGALAQPSHRTSPSCCPYSMPGDLFAM